MLVTNYMLYDLDDVTIIPAPCSEIEHRSDVNILDENNMLPIFTSPMPCVVDERTFNTYEKYGINAMIPRTVPLDNRIMHTLSGRWTAFSLDEFITTFISNNNFSYSGDGPMKVLIDIANGHMLKLHNVAKEAKDKFGNKMTLMIGNVAHPKTYKNLIGSGVDFVRLSIGTGSGCTTATNCGTFYPMASLIDECHMMRINFDGDAPKIVADGGLSNYRRMFKALALGADYVMLGGALSRLEDSAGEIKLIDGVPHKIYYGMASVQGQESLGKNINVPEGKMVYNEINGTIKSFTDEFTKYLQSTCSYCNAKTLNEFIGKVQVVLISQTASKQFNQKQ